MTEVQQIELFPFDELNQKDRQDLLGQIRQSYWHLRNLRSGRFGQAAQWRHSRKVAAIKRRLQMPGGDAECQNEASHALHARHILRNLTLHNINYTKSGGVQRIVKAP